MSKNKNIILQKIGEGDIGSVAAAKIYNNDEKLFNAIRYLKDYLDSYDSFISISVSGGTVEIKTEPGESNSAVMTQKATTDFVNQQVDDMCKIGQTIMADIEMPPSGCFVNVWVSRASSNAQGHSLTVMYNDIEDLKRRNDTITELQEKIEQLESRIEQLENNI
jgi:hypothetical protein